MKPITSLFGLVAIFSLATLFLFTMATWLPQASNQKYKISFPSSLEHLKQMASFLKSYKEEHYLSVLLLFCSAYLYKQTFAIPGSVFMNLLAGALFGLRNAFIITCTLTACGATCCFMLSKIFGRTILLHYFKEKVQFLEVKVKSNEDGLFFFLICLRLFPMTPNWFLNMASPVLGISIMYFFPSVFIGLMPYNFICCQMGCILSQLESINDVLTLDVMLKLTLVAVVVGLPGILLRLYKKRESKKID